MPAQSKKNLRYYWIAGGLASSLSRFIPVPVVDTLLDERAKRFSIDKTLKFHGRTFSAKELSVLYKDNSGFKGWAAGVAKQLATYPVRKVARLVTASTALPKDFSRTYLLARAVDLCLEDEMLENDSSSKERSLEAQKIRLAFDAAFERIDDLLFETTSHVIRREYTEMKPIVRDAFQKILGKVSGSKATPNRKNRKSSTTGVSKDEIENDSDFSTLISRFDDYFRNEMS